MQLELEEKLLEKEVAESELMMATMRKKMLRWKQKAIDSQLNPTSTASSRPKKKTPAQIEDELFNEVPIVDAVDLLRGLGETQESEEM